MFESLDFSPNRQIQNEKKQKTENPIENSMIEHIQRFSRILLFFSYFDFVHFRQFRCFNDDDS